MSSPSSPSPSFSKWTLRVSLLAWVLTRSASHDPQVKTVQRDDDVLLPCHGPRGADILLVKWIRPDLRSELYVFFFRNHHAFKKYQHPSFYGRVELTAPQMKDGDVSVNLKNVTIKDTGTYECHVRIRGNSSELISIIQLQVKDHQQITVKTGHDVTLQCLDPRGGDVQVLEWTRLDPEEDVFVCRHGKKDCNTPHPSLKNRVKLMDPQMKDGNVSVIVKNVTVNDAGIYECKVGNSNTQLWLIRNIHLVVTVSDGHTEDGGDKDGGDKDGGEMRGTLGLVTAVSAFVVVAAVFSAVLIIV